MKDYNNRLWNKINKTKHKSFRFRRSLRNVKPNQVVKNRYGVLIKVTVLDDQILIYIIL